MKDFVARVLGEGIVLMLRSVELAQEHRADRRRMGDEDGGVGLGRRKVPGSYIFAFVIRETLMRAHDVGVPLKGFFRTSPLGTQIRPVRASLNPAPARRCHRRGL